MSNFIPLLKKSLKLYMGTKWTYLLIIPLLGVFGIVFLLGTDTKFTLYFVYLFAPIFLIIVPATLISSEKNSRFTDITLTYPVTEREYFFSRYLLSVIMGLLYLAITLPFMAILFAFVGMPLAGMFLKYFIASLLIILFVSGLGTMIASVCGSRQTVSVAISLIFAFGYILAAIFYGFPESHGLVVISASMRLSPIVSISDYMGFPPFMPICYVDRGISLIVPIVSILLFPLVGFLVFAYLKEKKKVIAVMLAALSIVTPVLATAAIDTNYNVVAVDGDYFSLGDFDAGVFIDTDTASGLSDEEKGAILEHRRISRGGKTYPARVAEDGTINGVLLVNLMIPEDLSNKSNTEEVEITIKSPDDRLRFDGAAEQSYICKPKTAGLTDCNYAWIEIPVEMKIAVPKLDIAGRYLVDIVVPDNWSLNSKTIIKIAVPYYLTTYLNFQLYSIAAFIPTLLGVSMPLLLRKRRYKKLYK
jgi:ABC-type transport system involved in multi-copper enzyme maturation permease subunit